MEPGSFDEMSLDEWSAAWIKAGFYTPDMYQRATS